MELPKRIKYKIGAIIAINLMTVSIMAGEAIPVTENTFQEIANSVRAIVHQFTGEQEKIDKPFKVYQASSLTAEEAVKKDAEQ